MKKIILFASLLFGLFPLNGICQESQPINEEYENLSGEYAQCAAYFRLVYHATNASGDTETANSYRELEDMAMLFALVLAQPGRNKDLAIEVTNSRIEMYIKMMKQEINNRNENISILINKYHFDCMEIIKEPPGTLKRLPF